MVKGEVERTQNNLIIIRILIIQHYSSIILSSLSYKVTPAFEKQ